MKIFDELGVLKVDLIFSRFTMDEHELIHENDKC